MDRLPWWKQVTSQLLPTFESCVRLCNVPSSTTAGATYVFLSFVIDTEFPFPS